MPAPLIGALGVVSPRAPCVRRRSRVFLCVRLSEIVWTRRTFCGVLVAVLMNADTTAFII